MVHFDPTRKLTLACGASSYSLGVVLAYILPGGSERPIGFASRALSKAEHNYSQLEREGLLCIFGIKKFNDYLFGRLFELVADHKLLMGLLKEDRAASAQASARIKQRSLFLAAYEYNLVFRNTAAHGNAAALTRLPLPEETSRVDTPPEIVLLLEHLEEATVTASDIRVWTAKDSKLSRVLQLCATRLVN